MCNYYALALSNGSALYVAAKDAHHAELIFEEWRDQEFALTDTKPTELHVSAWEIVSTIPKGHIVHR
jgi:hypothetical protein